MDIPTHSTTGSTVLCRGDFQALDASDPLSRYRDQFDLPTGVIYLDGNSLGPLPHRARERVEDVVSRQWGKGLIRSWNDERWIHLPLSTGGKIAGLIGAKPAEVVVADSTSVNLFKLLSVALRLNPDRRVIVTESGNFPSDLYIIDGLTGLLEHDYEVRRAAPGRVEDAIDESVAVVSVTHVNYRNGWMHDMQALTAKAHEAGAIMLWDLAHSAGSMPLALNEFGVDLAVGCGYKFLNGGPGAPSFLFIAEHWHDRAQQPLTGWLGHANPFQFDEQYVPANGIARNLCGTPPVLSMASLDAALDVFETVDMHQVRSKSVALGQLFLQLIEQELAGFGFEIACPRDPERRGSQVCIAHEQGHAIMQALIDQGFIGDFREPNILRFGLTPLYQRYEDIWDTAAALGEIMRTAQWREQRFQTREYVT